MPSNTPNLDLLKKDPVLEKDDTFNIQTMMNDNWDKIDLKAGEHEQRITTLEDDVSAPKYSSLLIQDSPIFSTGTGKLTTGEVIDVPLKVIEGQISDLVIKGNTRTNLVKSSNMNTDLNADGVVDDFTMYVPAGLTVTKLLDGGQKIDITANTNGTNQQISVYQDIPINAGEIISARYDGKISGGVTLGLGLQFYDSVNTLLRNDTITTIAPSNYTELRNENRTAPSGTVKVRIILVVIVTANSTGTIWVKNALLEKSTTVGSYISTGTKSTINSRVLSRSKNKFDGIWEYGGFVNSTGANYDVTDRIRNKNKYIRIKPNKNYIVGQIGTYFYWYDENKNFISYASRPANSYVTSPTNAKYVNIYIVSTDLKYVLQLEEGTIATTYEPYQDSPTLINAELSKLLNGIYDEVKGGKLYKRVSATKTIDGSMVSTITNSVRQVDTTVFDIIVNIFDTVPSNTTTTNDNAYAIVRGIKFKPNLLAGANDISWNIPNQYGIFATLNNGKMQIRISLSHVDTGWTAVPTLAQVQSYFNSYPMSLIYQLANEDVTDIDGFVPLIGFPDGDIIIEPQDSAITEFVAPTFEYKVQQNKAAQIDGNTAMNRQNAEEILRIYARLEVAGI